MIKKYRLIQGELAHQEEGCASRIYQEKGIDICYYEDVEKLINDSDNTRFIRDQMIDRLKKACGIESQELKVIEEEILKHVMGLGGQDEENKKST